MSFFSSPYLYSRLFCHFRPPITLSTAKIFSSPWKPWHSFAILGLSAFAFPGPFFFFFPNHHVCLSSHPDGDSVFDSTTGVHLPRHLTVPSSPTLFKLVGFGARQVTFLSFNVYCASIYIPSNSLALSAFWSHCSNTNQCHFDHAITDPHIGPIVMYLVPTRNSTASHLRDGFVRIFMQAVAQTKSQTDRENMLLDINEFKARFPTTSIEMGQSFMFMYEPNLGLRIIHQDRDLGLVKAPWLAQCLLHAYLRANKPISPLLRDNLLSQIPSSVSVT